MNDANSARADACAPEATGAGLTRRDIVRIGAWAVPAVVMASAVPAVAASTPPVYKVLAVRAEGPNWVGTDASVAPGIRFTTASSGPAYAIIVFTPASGAVPNPSVIFNTFSDGGDGTGLTITKSDSSYTVTGLLVDSAITKGITIKNVAQANGTFTVTYGSVSAGFVISGAGTASPKVRPA